MKISFSTKLNISKISLSPYPHAPSSVLALFHHWQKHLQQYDTTSLAHEPFFSLAAQIHTPPHEYPPQCLLDVAPYPPHICYKTAADTPHPTPTTFHISPAPVPNV